MTKEDAVKKIVTLADELGDSNHYGAASILYHLASSIVLNHESELVRLVNDYGKKKLKEINSKLKDIKDTDPDLN